MTTVSTVLGLVCLHLFGSVVSAVPQNVPGYPLIPYASPNSSATTYHSETPTYPTYVSIPYTPTMAPPPYTPPVYPSMPVYASSPVTYAPPPYTSSGVVYYPPTEVSYPTPVSYPISYPGSPPIYPPSSYAMVPGSLYPPGYPTPPSYPPVYPPGSSSTPYMSLPYPPPYPSQLPYPPTYPTPPVSPPSNTCGVNIVSPGNMELWTYAPETCDLDNRPVWSGVSPPWQR
jgi:hypothetical protein